MNKDLKTLDEIAKFYGTDKSSLVHDYCNKYEKYLPFKREEKLNILEIGVLDGQSLNTWRDYYYNSNITGIDIEPLSKSYESERVSVEIGSQTNSDFLDKLCQSRGVFDLIIDDGSHINSDVIFTFEKLFSNVKSKGIYIIEDSCTSYWLGYGGGYKSPKSTIEYFKNLIDVVNYKGVYSSSEFWWARKEELLIDNYKSLYKNDILDIESINFINSIIIITKK